MRCSGAAAVCLALGLSGALGACAGPAASRDALPAEEVAVVWRSPDEARRRAVQLKRQRGERLFPNSLHVDELAVLLGGDTKKLQMVDVQGRLAFADLRSEALRIAEFATRGARPLDWLPDRTRLLFSARTAEGPQLYEWVRESGSVRPLTNGPAAHPWGCYGPDGRIAYVEVRRSGLASFSRVFVSGPGGIDPRPVSPGPLDSHPSWSPDGRWLLWNVNAASNAPRIVALDFEGDGAPRAVARGRRPSFTPDGTWVVYSAPTPAGWRIWRMRPDGAGKRSLGSSGLDEHAPSVSRDGRWVVYEVEEGDRQSLRVRSLDGSADRPVLLDGDALIPVWN